MVVDEYLIPTATYKGGILLSYKYLLKAGIYYNRIVQETIKITTTHTHSYSTDSKVGLISLNSVLK